VRRGGVGVTWYNPWSWIEYLYRQPPPGSLCYSKGQWIYCPRGVSHDILATLLLIVGVILLAFILGGLAAAWRALR
jgi:ABC-type phosphate transport system permease subunit